MFGNSNNYFGNNGYQPNMSTQQGYGNVNPYLQRLESMQNGGRIDIVTVNGENGARAYQIPPNSRTLLLDESGSILWFVQSDGAGYRTVKPYLISEYVPEQAPQIDTKSLEDRIAKLEALIYEKPDNSNDEKTVANAKPKSNK